MNRVLSRLFPLLLVAALLLPSQPALAQTEPPAPQWVCFDDGTLDPCHNTINDIDFLSDTDAFAVGSSGTMLRWTNGAWSMLPRLTERTLIAVDMLSPTDGWVIDEIGHLMHYDGITLTPAEIPGQGTKKLLKLALTAASDGWATGPGITARWNGSTWSIFDAAWGGYDMSMYSATEGWIVYQYEVKHWNGTIWTVTSNGNTNNNEYSSIAAVAPGDAWLASQGLFHWDGTEWKSVTLPAPMNWLAVSGNRSDNVWLVGNGFTNNVRVAYRWNGSAWSDPEVVSAPTLPYRLKTAPDGSPWLFSGRQISRRTSSSWTVEIAEMPGFNKVHLVSSTDGWATLFQGGARRWNGTTWADYALLAGYKITAIDMVSPTDGWMVGTEISTGKFAALRWNGTGWSVNCYFTKLPMSISLFDANNGWLVGYNGLMAQWDGTAWVEKVGISTANLTTVHMPTATSAWAGGGNTSTLGKWDGTTWSSAGSTMNWSNLFEIFMITATEGWFGGYTKLVEPRIPPDFSNPSTYWINYLDGQRDVWIYALHMFSMEDGWAAASRGLLTGNYQYNLRAASMMHLSGNEWTETRLPLDGIILDMHMVSPGNGWAVTNTGVMLRYQSDGQTLSQFVFLPMVVSQK